MLTPTAYALAARKLHDMLDLVTDPDPLLRLIADDMECEPNGIAHAVTFATARIVSDPANAEFWRRLAGSLRKASSMV